MPAWLGAFFSHLFSLFTSVCRLILSPLIRPSNRLRLANYLVIISCCFLFLFPALTQASQLIGGPLGERSLQADQDKVTARVPDRTPPSPPILISPDNNSFVVTRRPPLVWLAATDDIAMGYYQLWIDGQLYLDSIPLTNYENADYTLHYDSGTHYYSLTSKKDLSEGTHTWKIVAFDQAAHSNSSATWSFTIDTLAPNFIINQIGTLAVTISAYDSSTIPSQPIELDLFNNEPLLRGTGEANSTITLTVTIPGYSNQTYTTTIDGNGNWSIHLNLLPRDVIISFNFVIEDQAGLITILDGVQVILRSPPPGGVTVPTPTSAQTAQAPSTPPTQPENPVSSPITKPPTLPSIFPPFVLSDFWPTADWHPFFTKPLSPIKAYLYALLAKSATVLPPALAIPLSQIPTQATGQFGWLLAWLNWFIALALPVLVVTFLLIKLRFQISLGALSQVLGAAHLWPFTTGLLPNKPGGWVFDPATNKGVSFAKVRLLSIEKDQEVAVGISDERGFFAGFSYLSNQPPTEKYQHYRLVVEKNGRSLEPAAFQHTWPQQTLSSFIYLHNTYQGGIVSFNHRQPAPFWLLPTTAPAETWTDKILGHIACLNLLPPWLLISHILVTFLVVVFYTTLPNIVVVLYYLVLAGVRLGRALQPPNLSVYLTNENNQPLAAGLVLCRPIYDPTIVWIGHTNLQGYARLKLSAPAIRRHTASDQLYLLSCHQTQRYATTEGMWLASSRLHIGSSAAVQQVTLSQSCPPLTGCCI